MRHATFLFDNQADLGTATASSTAGATLGANNVLNEQRSKYWRSANGTFSYLDVTLSNIYSADTVALVDVNLSTAGTIRVQSWSDSIGGADMNTDVSVTPSLYVNTKLSAAAYGDGPYGIGAWGSNQAITQSNIRNITIIPLPAPSTDPYWRITFDDLNSSYQQCGRLFIGNAQTFSKNMSYGWSAQREDETISRKSLGGQTYRQQRDSRLRLSGDFALLSDAERTDMLIRMQEYGAYKPFIFSIFPETTNKGLSTTVYGRFDSVATNHASFGATQLPFTIVEEL